MARDKSLPERVHCKGGRYYLVVAAGKKRIWHSLSRIKDGLPALYTSLAAKLAELQAADVRDDRIAALISIWQQEVGCLKAPKTQANENSRLRTIAEAFAEFRAGEIDAPTISEFLVPFKGMPRTHNQYRALLRELMRFAIEKGMRRDNPVAGVIRTVTEPPRTRYITDSEMRRIKVGGIYGDDGKLTRSGLMLAALIDMAYLTGQDIGMLLKLRWSRDPDDPSIPFVGDDGIFFRRAKTAKTTGSAVTIGWTPKLLEVLERLKALRAQRLLKTRASQRVVTEYVFTRQDGLAFTYSGAQTAWKRAVKRAGVKSVMFRDLRAKALTDKDRNEGIRAANAMGQHSTESQTADYIRLRAGRRAKANG
jgi:integrase